MSKKTILEKFTSKIASQKEKVMSKDSAVEEPSAEEVAVADGDVDHLWMTEDQEAEKPKLEKDPRIDTGILRNRIADKIAKMDNH